MKSAVVLSPTITAVEFQTGLGQALFLLCGAANTVLLCRQIPIVIQARPNGSLLYIYLSLSLSIYIYIYTHVCVYVYIPG